MVLVAIAGGSSPSLGTAIIKAIKEGGRHEVVILSRVNSISTRGWTSRPETDIRLVDYGSLRSLRQGLQGVHTLISVIKSRNPNEMVTYHQNMLEAAKVAGVKRFAPSQFGMGQIAHEKIDLLQPKIHIWDLCQQSGLECTRFTLGMFMNYLGLGCPADRKEEALAGLEDDLYLGLIDIGAGHALVPVTDQGQPARMSMCELGDVGRFVAAALDLDKWEDEMSMVGSTTTMDEVVWMAERMGRLMRTETVTKEQAQQRIAGFDQQLEKDSPAEAMKGKMLAQMMECLCDDQVGSGIVKPLLNELCPQVQPLAFDEYITMYWSDSRDSL